MEWVVTTGKNIDEAKDRALDQLGVAADEAEFEVVEEAKTGLFGRLKSEAQVRARVRPAQVRPKQDRRDRRRGKGKRDDSRKQGDSSNSQRDDSRKQGDSSNSQRDESRKQGDSSNSQRDRSASNGDGDSRSSEPARSGRGDSSSSGGSGNAGDRRQRSKRPRQQKEGSAMHGETDNEVTPEEVGAAAVTFMEGLTEAFGAEATAELTVDGTDLDVRMNGSELGLLVGPAGRTLTAVQDLARVAAQRRLGDHETRLRIDVGGYREKRRAALERFALAVANEVVEQGSPKALEPMSSADRKAVHDALAEVAGVTSRSEGDDPNRRVVITPE